MFENFSPSFYILQHMVSSFRVTELQVLLGFAGRNKSGRKHELQQRALSLLEKGCSTPIQIKIKELYRRRFPRRMVIPSGPSQTASFLSHLVDQNQRTSNPGSSYSPSSSQPPLPSMPQNLHSHGFTRTPKLEPFNGLPQLSRNLVIHPDVHYRSLPFYDQLAELVKPSSLSELNLQKKCSEYSLFLFIDNLKNSLQKKIVSAFEMYILLVMHDNWYDVTDSLF